MEGQLIDQLISYGPVTALAALALFLFKGEIVKILSGRGTASAELAQSVKDATAALQANYAQGAANEAKFDRMIIELGKVNDNLIDLRFAIATGQK